MKWDDDTSRRPHNPIPEKDRKYKRVKNIDSRLRTAVYDFVREYPNMADRPKAVHSHLKDKHKSLTVDMVRTILES